MPTLRQKMTEDMQLRNLSPQTQSSYLLQVTQFTRHFGVSPETPYKFSSAGKRVKAIIRGGRRPGDENVR